MPKLPHVTVLGDIQQDMNRMVDAVNELTERMDRVENPGDKHVVEVFAPARDRGSVR